MSQVEIHNNLRTKLPHHYSKRDKTLMTLDYGYKISIMKHRESHPNTLAIKNSNQIYDIPLIYIYQKYSPYLIPPLFQCLLSSVANWSWIFTESSRWISLESTHASSPSRYSRLDLRASPPPWKGILLPFPPSGIEVSVNGRRAYT